MKYKDLKEVIIKLRKMDEKLIAATWFCLGVGYGIIISWFL